MKLFLKLLFFTFFITYNLLLTAHVFAASEFSTSYNINYTVDLKGVTNTNQQISLKNIYENIYATQYSIIIGSTNISSVIASDNFGDLDPEIKTEANSTKINLNFDRQIIGKDKERNVNISYKTPDFATVKGQVLEVGFPLLQNSSEMDDYQVTIHIPLAFGKATQIVPTPSSESKNESFSIYKFEKDKLKNSDSITATFGTSQIYDFAIDYHLENPNSIKGKTELALIPDTNYQQVIYESIDPKPENVIVDEDGNWLAQYILDPKAKLTVKTIGSIFLSYFPKAEYAKELSAEQIATYTQTDEYWESDSSEISDLAQNLNSVNDIYDYLVSNFSYDYDRLNNNAVRMGAKQAILNPDQAICMEFTDAFIALTRAKNIPAREHNGYAYTENDKLRPLSLNQDVLHAWPEYYDKVKKQWIMVDPTWGNTTGGLNFFEKFDLDHITFVIHGKDSTYPITAGSYKYTDTETKDIRISFADKFTPITSIQIKSRIPEKGITGLPISGSINIYNSGNIAIYNTPVLTRINHLGKILKDYDQTISILPPFANFQQAINFNTSWKSRGGSYLLEIEVKDMIDNTKFVLEPLINYSVIIPVLLLVSIIIIIIILKLKKTKHKHKLLKSQQNYLYPKIYRS